MRLRARNCGSVVCLFIACGALGNGCSSREVASEPVAAASQAVLTCSPTPTTSAYPAGDYVEGYVDRQSYSPTETVSLHVSARAGSGGSSAVTAYYYRITNSHPLSNLGPLVATKSMTSAQEQLVPDDASHCGARWSATPGLGLTAADRAGWPSGLYVAKLVLDADSTKVFWIPFVLKAEHPSAAPNLVIASTNTWQAYNPWPATRGLQGHSYYVPANPPYSEEGRHVSFLRPNPAANPAVDTTPANAEAHLVPAEREGVDWLVRHNVPFTMIADSDDAVVAELEPREVHTVVLQGHNEYWTAGMRSAIDAYLRRGGHVLNLSGNVMNWEVSYGGDEGMQMRTSKTDSPKSWQRCDITDHFELALNSDVLGTVYGVWGANTWFTPSDLSHWSFAGTGYTSGSDPIGKVSDFGNLGIACANSPCYAYSWEFDYRPANGTSDDVSSIVLAGAYGWGPNDGMTYTGKPHGGAVFGANSIMFTQALDAMNGSADADPKLSQMILNVIDRFARPVPVAPGDITGKNAVEPDFFSDFYCHAPAGDAYAGNTWVASMRSDGVHKVQEPSGGPWTGGSLPSWCGGAGDRFGTGDFNGDRRVDSYCYHTGSGTIEVALSDGVSALVPALTSSGSPYWATNFWCSGAGVTVTVGDVDGNGRDDILCHNGTGSGPYNGYTWVARAHTSSNAFLATEQWGTGFCNWAGSQFGAADFDGDGRSDIWCHDSNVGTTYVQLSTGVSTTGFHDPYNPSSSVAWLSSWCYGSQPIDFGTADFNGDGFADIYCHSGITGNAWIAFGRGQYVASPPSGPAGGFRFPYVSDVIGGTIISAYCVGGKFGVGDFNGDGLSDVYCHSGWTTDMRLISRATSGGATDCTSTAYAHVNWSFGPATTVMTDWCGWSSSLDFGSAN